MHAANRDRKYVGIHLPSMNSYEFRFLSRLSCCYHDFLIIVSTYLRINMSIIAIHHSFSPFFIRFLFIWIINSFTSQPTDIWTYRKDCDGVVVINVGI